MRHSGLQSAQKREVAARRHCQSKALLVLFVEVSSTLPSQRLVGRSICIQHLPMQHFSHCAMAVSGTALSIAA